jgi:hypothetical protein
MPPAGKNVKVDADKAIRVPPPYCANASDPDVLIVTPAPAVIVDTPAPLFAMKNTVINRDRVCCCNVHHYAFANVTNN